MKKRTNVSTLNFKLHVFSLLTTVSASVLFFAFFMKRNTAEIFIENKARSNLERVEIRLCNHLKTLNHIMPSETKSADFKISSDCEYSVRAVFEDKSSLTGQFSYVTKGFNFKDYLSVEQEQLFVGPQIIEPEIYFWIRVVSLFFLFVITYIFSFKLFHHVLMALRRKIS